MVAHIGQLRFGQHRAREEIWRHLDTETLVQISERRVQREVLSGRVLGVVSDAQESIRVAGAAVFPGVPHQLCQYHALREAAKQLWEANRHLLVEVKRELRPLRDVEERTRRPGEAEPADPASAVVLDIRLRRTGAAADGARAGEAAVRLRGAARAGRVGGSGRDPGSVPRQKGDPRLARLRTLIRRAHERCAACVGEVRQASA